MSDNRLEKRLKEKGLSFHNFFDCCYGAAAGCLKSNVDRLTESLEEPAHDGTFTEHTQRVQAIKHFAELMEVLSALFAEAGNIDTDLPF